LYEKWVTNHIQKIPLQTLKVFMLSKEMSTKGQMYGFGSTSALPLLKCINYQNKTFETPTHRLYANSKFVKNNFTIKMKAQNWFHWACQFIYTEIW
jgi:hypothetical protein